MQACKPMYSPAFLAVNSQIRAWQLQQKPTVTLPYAAPHLAEEESNTLCMLLSNSWFWRSERLNSELSSNSSNAAAAAAAVNCLLAATPLSSISGSLSLGSPFVSCRCQSQLFAGSLLTLVIPRSREPWLSLFPSLSIRSRPASAATTTINSNCHQLHSSLAAAARP